jgi:pimeloyl-ACP methyl ester carboxylesterase
MSSNRLSPFVLRLVLIAFGLYLLLVVLVFLRQRSLLFFPSHDSPGATLKPWKHGSEIIGYCRPLPHPRAVWLMTHGNAGQAADRDYVLPRLSDQDALYVLEYPGYGARQGAPTRASMNQAAADAYHLLRSEFPTTPICVLGESIGTGPACALASEKAPPDKIVLVTPFDSLASVAAEKFAWLPVKLLLRDRWDNVEALRHYTGPIDIFAALQDHIIPVAHARTLAGHFPRAKLILIPGGHNDWAAQSLVKIEPSS